MAILEASELYASPATYEWLFMGSVLGRFFSCLLFFMIPSRKLDMNEAISEDQEHLYLAAVSLLSHFLWLKSSGPVREFRCPNQHAYILNRQGRKGQVLMQIHGRNTAYTEEWEWLLENENIYTCTGARDWAVCFWETHRSNTEVQRAAFLE